MYHDFRIMNALIGDVYYAELSEVEKLFAAELRVAQRRVITKGNAPRV